MTIPTTPRTPTTRRSPNPEPTRATVGAALARLGALYALHGNRRLAQQIWRRGRRHRDPRVATAFATERAAIGRVTRIHHHA